MPQGLLIQEWFQDLADELVTLRGRKGDAGESEERLAELERLFSDAEKQSPRTQDWQRPHLTGDPEIDRIERAFEQGAYGPDDDPWADENGESCDG